jgi:hypothetical protein
LEYQSIKIALDNDKIATSTIPVARSWQASSASGLCSINRTSQLTHSTLGEAGILIYIIVVATTFGVEKLTAQISGGRALLT